MQWSCIYMYPIVHTSWGTVYTAHSSGEGHNRNHEEDHATDYSQDVHVADLQDLQGRDLLWKEGDGGR